MKRVVVTGLGLISSLGIGLEESWRNGNRLNNFLWYNRPTS